jgi:hypothetical protein
MWSLKVEYHFFSTICNIELELEGRWGRERSSLLRSSADLGSHQLLKVADRVVRLALHAHLLAEPVVAVDAICQLYSCLKRKRAYQITSIITCVLFGSLFLSPVIAATAKLLLIGPKRSCFEMGM